MIDLVSPAFVSSIIMMGMAIAAVRAYWPLMRGVTKGTFEGRMFRSVMWICATLVIRSAYWDTLQSLLPDPAWTALRDALRGQQVSTLTNIGFIIGLYHALYAVRFLIPVADRSDWPWWKAWTYPSGPCIVRVKRRKQP